MGTINIGYVSSDEYVGLLSVSIVSILVNSDDADELNFIVLTSGISDDNQRKIESLKSYRNFNIEYVNMSKYNNQFKDINEGVSIVSNYRIKIASIKPDLDKIIFLDTDIIAMQSFQELYSLDLKDNYIAAACDPGAIIQQNYTLEDDEKFPNPRFNTGLMLINLELWRKDNIEEKILDGMIWYSTKYKKWPDQNAINMICKDKIMKLEGEWNVCPILNQQGYYQIPDYWNKSIQTPKVVHMCAYPKPYDTRGLMWEDVFWKYAKMTPFYEQFLDRYYENKFKKIESDYNKALNNLNNLNEAYQILLAKINYKNNKNKYYKYRLLSNFVFGKTKERYLYKKNFYKNEIDLVKIK